MSGPRKHSRSGIELELSPDRQSVKKEGEAASEGISPRGNDDALRGEGKSVVPADELTAWERVQLARHEQRPRMLDYTSRILDDLVELHGDRAVGDDKAVVAGIGRFQGQTIVIAGQQKGNSTDERIQRNFGMARPEGYRKALRLFRMAERLRLPIVTFIDTFGADPGVEAEERGQGPIIAQSLLESFSIDTPIMAVILSEGGSGGALALAIGDWIAMFENAVYMVCPPERCAEILWRDVEKKELAAEALKITAHDLLEMEIVDSVLPEPGGGAHRNPDGAAQSLANELERFLSDCKKGRWNLRHRQEKFNRMGTWQFAPKSLLESDAKAPDNGQS